MKQALFQFYFFCCDKIGKVIVDHTWEDKAGSLTDSHITTSDKSREKHAPTLPACTCCWMIGACNCMPATGRCMLDACCQMIATGCLPLGARYLLITACCWMLVLHACCCMTVSGCLLLDACCWMLHACCWMHAACQVSSLFF